MDIIITEIEAQQANQQWQAGTAHIIDVREQSEHDIIHVPNIPLLPMQSTHWTPDAVEPYQGKAIVIMCHSGKRSLNVAQQLVAAGYTGEIYSLAGGITAWNRENLPVAGSAAE